MTQAMSSIAPHPDACRALLTLIHSTAAAPGSHVVFFERMPGTPAAHVKAIGPCMPTSPPHGANPLHAHISIELASGEIHLSSASANLPFVVSRPIGGAQNSRFTQLVHVQRLMTLGLTLEQAITHIVDNLRSQSLW